MNKYTFTTVLALLLLVLILPVYAYLEPFRMEQAQSDLRKEFVSDAAVIYVQNCAVCHGASGAGIGATPALNALGLGEADYDFLYKTIARGRYDTIMTGWHTEESGILNDYQIDELIALIRYVNWDFVGELAAEQGLIPPTLPVPAVDEAFLADVAALDPQGVVWAAGMQLYAHNCTVCHGVNGAGSDLGVPLNTPEVREKETAVLVNTITNGVPGAAMVAWEKALEPDEIEAIATFLHNWDKITEQNLTLTPPEPIRIDLDNPQDVLALGERIFTTTCTACHGENGSGGVGPALNSQQVLTNRSDAQILNTIINGGHRPNSAMPAFGDRFTTVELEALVNFIRAWEPTAPIVENPRGTAQGGGPPWLRATPDANNPIAPSANETSTRGPNQTFTGAVVNNDSNQLTFRSFDGALVDAMLGPPWFWAENGISLNPGDRIELEGFESAGHMELNWIINQTTGQRVDLRTPDGMPVWNN